MLLAPLQGIELEREREHYLRNDMHSSNMLHTNVGVHTGFTVWGGNSKRLAFM